MAAEGTEGEREVEEASETDAALLHFGNYSEMRATLPWEQRTVKERVLYYVDRIFLFLLAIFLLVLLGETAYKVWYVTNWKGLYQYTVALITHLFSQEEEEELLEL